MSVTTTDPIADMLTRIRNAILVRKNEVSLPHSNIKENVARSLQANGFLDSVSVTDLSVGKQLHIVIYAADENPRQMEGGVAFGGRDSLEYEDRPGRAGRVEDDGGGAVADHPGSS